MKNTTLENCPIIFRVELLWDLNYIDKYKNKEYYILSNLVLKTKYISISN